MPLRVLHIGKFYPPHRGGMEVFLANLVTAQRASGMEAAALVHGTPQADDPPWLVRVPVQGHISYAPIALGFRQALRQAIRHFRPDVLHLHMPNNSALWVLTLVSAHKIPWVIHWHADVVASRIRWTVRLAYLMYRPFEQAVLRRSARIIVTSPPYVQASVPLRRWHDRCAVVPLGLPVASPAPLKQDLCQYRYGPLPRPLPHQWERREESPSPTGGRGVGERVGHSICVIPLEEKRQAPHPLRLLSIGRLTYYKGFETLIAAVAPLRGVELTIIGAGELHAQLQAQIARQTPAGCAPHIHLLGNVDEARKNALLAQCDVFCLASRERTEAFGIATLEAMQHGKPCIVSDLPGSGLPWVVRTANCGLTVPPEDIPAWQAAIARMQADAALRQRLGQAGQQALAQHFSMPVCARHIAAQYALALPRALPAAVTRGILIVIPARNEARSIADVLQRLRHAHWHDILVVDDQSTDDTGAVARAAGARVLTPLLPVGAWGGMQAGILHALRSGYAAVITMDADGQHEVAEIPTLLAARHRADLIIGAFPERASRMRQWAWQWFRQLAGFDLRDLTSGFRLYNRAAMRTLASHEATLLDWQDLGALLLARQHGLCIKEVPVTMNLRSDGKSRIFHSWFSVARYMGATTLLCLARWRSKKR